MDLQRETVKTTRRLSTSVTGRLPLERFIRIVKKLQIVRIPAPREWRRCRSGDRIRLPPRQVTKTLAISQRHFKRSGFIYATIPLDFSPLAFLEIRFMPNWDARNAAVARYSDLSGP